MIFYKDQTAYPIEIKKNAAPKNAVKNFSVLSPGKEVVAGQDASGDLTPIKTALGTGLVICLASDIIPIDRKNWFVPAWVI